MEKQAHLNHERNILIQKIEQLLEGPMTFLGFVWLVLLVIDLSKGLNPTLSLLSSLIWIIFIIDFLLKFILAPHKIKFLKQNVLVAISLLVPALRVIRVLRFARVFRSLRSLNLVKVITSLNRTMHSLNATMVRRGFKYVIVLTILVVFAGSAGMYAFDNNLQVWLTTYTYALWWTFMLITSIGSDYWPQTPEGRALCFLLALYGFAVFGYITATLASFFVGRDAEEDDAPVAGSEDIEKLRKQIELLTEAVNNLQNKNEK